MALNKVIDMKVRRLDKNKDMTFGSGNLNFHEDSIEGVAQNVYTALSLWLGEWFLDTSAGTDWMGKCLGKNTVSRAETEIRRAILSTDGVNEILNLSTSFDNFERKVTVDANINTLYGTTNITVVRTV